MRRVQLMGGCAAFCIAALCFVIFRGTSGETVFNGHELALKFDGAAISGRNSDGRPFEALFLTDGMVELRVQDGIASLKPGITADGPAIHNGAWRIANENLCIAWRLDQSSDDICYRITFDGKRYRAYRGEIVDSYFRVVLAGGGLLAGEYEETPEKRS